MKKTSTTLKLLLGIFFFSLVMPAISQSKQKVEYMLDEQMDKVFEFAREKKKPVAVYVNSAKCFDSRKFTREIMSSQRVANFIKKHYFTINADVTARNGNVAARKLNVIIVPSLILFDCNQSLRYQLELKMDSNVVFDQFSGFLSAMSLNDQVQLMVSTNNMEQEMACKSIGASYARSDFKKFPGNNPEDMVTKRTLGIPTLVAIETGYLEEWERLVDKAKKQKNNTPVDPKKQEVTISK